MDDLRLILALLGLGVIGGVYAFTRLQQHRPQRRPARPRREPTLHEPEPDQQAVEQELARMGDLVADREPAGQAPQPDGERLLVISVVAEGDPFSGADLVKAFESNGLVFGEQGIYHRMTDRQGARCPVFGIANLVKPGTFSPRDMNSFTTPGITLFLQLPSIIDDLEAFDDFVTTAERLAVALAAGLRDERHNVLTHQALMQVRQTIAEARVHQPVAS